MSTRRGLLQLNCAVPYPHINVFNLKYKVICNVQEQFLYCPVGSNAQHLSPSCFSCQRPSGNMGPPGHLLNGSLPRLFFASQMFLDMEIRTVHLLIELDFWIVFRVYPIQIRFKVLRFHLRAMVIIC